MKRLLTLLIFAISLQTYAQLADAFNYQATIRAESGDLLVNTNVNFKVTIFEGQGVGASYQELHFVGSDDLGHVNFVVGYGEPLDGSMSEIDWSMGNYYMKVELDTGQGFVDMGDTQLLSVPYALYAMDSGGEVGDLQSVLDAGGEAEVVMSDDNLEGLKVMSTGGDNPDRNYNGIQSVISGTNGRNIALSGISEGDNPFRNYGVWGTANGSSGLNGGVLGTADSDVGENRGVWSFATGTTDSFNYGVTGTAYNSGSTNIAGGFYAEGGEVESPISIGVDARAANTSSNGANYGVYANAFGASQNIGILASAPAASEGSLNYAGYFSGDVYVDQTGYLKAENTPVADNDVVNKAYLESVLQSYDDRLAVLEEVVESLQESGSLLVDQDGNIVLTQEYGEDTWAVENVKVVTYRDGTPIPYVANLNDQFDSSIGYWTYANGDPSTGEILYNRQAIMGIWDADSAGDPSQRKELAPEGWHVASNEDWNSLIEYMTNTYGGNFAKEIASIEGWIYVDIEDTPGFVPEENNASGFNLKPSGFGYVANSISSFGQNSVVWGDIDETSLQAGYFFKDYASPVPGLYEIGSEFFFFSARFVQGEAEDNNVDGYCGNGIIEQALGEQCDDGNEDPNDGCDGCMIVEVDLDGDGYSVAQGDCNDNNANVYPGAVEVCDDFDNNCNGTVDENDLGSSFLGDYVLSFVSGGIAAANNVPVFGNDVIISLNETTNSLSQRSFSIAPYADIAALPTVTVFVEFYCGLTTLASDVDTGIGCTDVNVILGSANAWGEYNLADDSQFSLVFAEDVGAVSCGDFDSQEGTNTYTFTKVN